MSEGRKIEHSPMGTGCSFNVVEKISKTPASIKAKAKKNKVTVSWKKVTKKKLLAKIKNTQVQVAKDKNFTKIVADQKVKKTKTKLTIDLDKKKTYYVRVRYVSKKGHSNWSRVKKVKTKT